MQMHHWTYNLDILGEVFSKECDGGSTGMAIGSLRRKPSELVEVRDVGLCCLCPLVALSKKEFE